FNTRSASGTTPLLRAIINQNFEAANWLLDRVSPDPNSENNEDFTPARAVRWSLENPRVAGSHRADFAALLKRLQAIGGKPEPRSDENRNFCQQRNHGLMRFERIRSLIDSCDVENVDQLLRLLPKECLANSIPVYKPRGLIEGDRAHPAMIVMC